MSTLRETADKFRKISKGVETVKVNTVDMQFLMDVISRFEDVKAAVYGMELIYSPNGGQYVYYKGYSQGVSKELYDTLNVIMKVVEK
jgi:hypothetical protein